MKKLLSLIICIALLLSFSASVSAASGATVGFNTRTIYFNSKAYSAKLEICYCTTYGAYTKATTIAAVDIRFNTITIQYDTVNYGYITNTGGWKLGTFTPTKTTILSYYVPCSKGMDQVITYRSINASVDFFADQTYNLAASV